MMFTNTFPEPQPDSASYMFVFKIIDEGKWCLWYSITNIKGKFELQPLLVLQQDILSEKEFYKKILLCPLSLK